MITLLCVVHCKSDRPYNWYILYWSAGDHLNIFTISEAFIQYKNAHLSMHGCSPWKTQKHFQTVWLYWIYYASPYINREERRTLRKGKYRYCLADILYQCFLTIWPFLHLFRYNLIFQLLLKVTHQLKIPSVSCFTF